MEYKHFDKKYALKKERFMRWYPMARRSDFECLNTAHFGRRYRQGKVGKNG